MILKNAVFEDIFSAPTAGDVGESLRRLRGSEASKRSRETKIPSREKENGNRADSTTASWDRQEERATNAGEAPKVEEVAVWKERGQVEKCISSLASSAIFDMASSAPLRTLKDISRSSILANFLKRETPTSLPSASSPSSTPAPFASGSNPFAPTKREGANSWTTARYSVRRQKVLKKAVEALGWPANVLPTTPVVVKPVRKIRMLVGSPHIPKTAVLNELEMERKGPYIGRKGAAFKGKVWERQKAKRIEELRVALAGTDLKEQVWRKVSSAFTPLSDVADVRRYEQGRQEEKKKGRPALPF